MENIKSVMEKGTSVMNLIKSVTDGQRKFASLPSSETDKMENLEF